MRDDKTENAASRPFLSVVVPAFNEEGLLERNLEILCGYLGSLESRYRWELIIVNDGSTDRTGEIAEAFAAGRNGVYVLHHMFNFRLGQALKYAFNNCQGDIVVVLDIDLSYSPDHIKRMLDKMEETRAKIVIASPYAKGGTVSHVPLVRRLLSVWANKFLCVVATRDWYSDRLTNITGMVRAYDGEFLRRLNLRAMDVDINPEIIYKAKILRARIVEIPARLDWQPEKTPAVKAKRRRSSFRVVRGIVQSVLNGFILRPFLFFMMPGFVLFLLSIYPLGWTIIHTAAQYRKLAGSGLSVDYRLSEAISGAFKLSPHSFLVGGIALLVAIQLISLGFLAFQKKRYFEELFHLGSSLFKESRVKIAKDFAGKTGPPPDA
ncbi:MAG: glycosyltransferase family 2 protein [Candidatus Aminicenantales bacterium]